MKILLLGEYSNVHWTLGEGLRRLGHNVTVVSNGDFWKNYNRDISLTRTSTRLGGLAYGIKLLSVLPKLRGYDIVQLINPMFLELRAERLMPIYKYLRRHNRHVVLCAFGMDYYWVNECCTNKPLRYSDFNMGETLRHNKEARFERNDWLGTAKEQLNRYIATDCDKIAAGLYEYWVCYKPSFKDKTVYIPFPIKPSNKVEKPKTVRADKRIRIFIGINKERNEYKGTDIMLRAAEDLCAKYPDKAVLVKAESVPFHEYVKLMDDSDILLDQLYSYTPAMNALQAMSKGIVCVGGGEPENYEILGEHELRPIINVLPNYNSVYEKLRGLLEHPERVETLKEQSVKYIERHHDYIKVARQYVAMYNDIMKKTR